MNFYNETVQEALDQNEINEEKWKNYKESVSETRKTVNTFLKSYKMDIMVPLGKKAFIRGTLQHTNDILVSHSSNYFSGVSNFQANEILQHRNIVCEKKLKELDKEKDLFKGKLDVSTNEAFSEQEIIEEYNEEAEAEWRKRHRESIKKQKAQEAEERKSESDMKINDLLDQYELMEEMTGELEGLEEKEDYDYEDLLKFISGEQKAPKSKKRIAHNVDENKEKSPSDVQTDKQQSSIPASPEQPKISLEEEPTNNKENRPTEVKKPRRKVRFSTSLEDVKVFEESACQSAFPPIQITFEHSNERFNPEIYNGIDDDVIFKHPGDFVKILSTFESENPKQKSILKETNYKYDKNPVLKHQNNDRVDEDIYDSLSKFPLICGDVIERKPEEVKIVSETEKTGKKVSKFKVLRNKVK